MSQLRGTIRSFDSNTHRATVRLDGSTPRTVTDIRATAINASEFQPGRRCLVDTGDHNDPTDAVVIAVWP